MIIVGNREVQLQSKNFEEGFCTNCGQKGSICSAVFSKYAHVMWVPFFPYSKRKVIWCNNCGKELSINEISSVLQPKINEFYRKQRTPLWQWLGLLLICASLATGIAAKIKENKDTKVYIEFPEVNDVYCIKYDEGYSLMYIAEIQDDSIFFITSDYTILRYSSVKKLHQPELYESDSYYSFSKDELNELFYEDKFIKTIWRNLPYSNKKDLKLRDVDIKENSLYTSEEVPFDEGDEEYEDEYEEEENNDNTEDDDLQVSD
ncbi:MAG: hypothetical protein LBV74_16020 [Tannerella sp.]|jgi:hypothetical protein|nr:hypothetical protein [Tannerella sp.]